MSDFFFSNETHFNEVIKNIIADGKEHLHVIADFDRTLTKAFVDGKPRSSLESILEEGWYLWSEYSIQSKKNFDKYYPIEIDPTIPMEEKKAMMLEWRTNQFALMLKTGITRDIIKNTMKSELIIFRQWYEFFFDMLKNNAIPLLVFSASGLWYEAIYHCLQNRNKLFDNIDIISNSFMRDETGKAIAIREPIIHSFNKGETVVHDLPIYKEIKDRKNIILLGDSLGDTHMADGFAYKNIIRIWFLNHDTPEHRKQFQEKFDVIILNDGSMDRINDILKKILQ
ncbi:MAG: hypothetical protein ACD_80C00167G0006 [uncultured bacterium (gcode 4)]|uniref:5'-nucleotidase n=1 Tax=uncultured bacterium (gcode 4) TaxID=1234023 RepID=K1XWD2_9BACT|nr:MAG: hypothetical protein ACD_80C00167G0006 [uncultured bacterium (gcode 4)]